MRKGPSTSGIILIALGIAFLGMNLGIFRISWDMIWPLFILIPGLIFEFSYFLKPTRGNAGLLVPGGVLLVISAIFYINIFFGWHMMSSLWPLFIMAPAFGLFQLFLFGGHEPGLLIPVFILGGLSLFFLSFSALGQFAGYILPVGLICFGVILLFGKGRKSDGHYEFHFGRSYKDEDDYDDDEWS